MNNYTKSRPIQDTDADGNMFDLSSENLMKEFYIDRGVKEQWHRVPTGEIVISHHWYVEQGEGDVSPEFEIMEVIPKGGLIQELKDLVNSK